MLDKIKKNHEAGYALLESLVGLVLLSIVSFSLIAAMPILLSERARLDKEQAIYHQLFELHGRDATGHVIIDEPFRIEAFQQGYEWCAIYGWRDGNERKICL